MRSPESLMIDQPTNFAFAALDPVLEPTLIELLWVPSETVWPMHWTVFITLPMPDTNDFWSGHPKAVLNQIP